MKGVGGLFWADACTPVLPLIVDPTVEALGRWCHDPACRLQSPALATASRARPSRFKATAQAEEEELAALPKFHARPVRRAAPHCVVLLCMPCALMKRAKTGNTPYCLFKHDQCNRAYQGL